VRVVIENILQKGMRSRNRQLTNPPPDFVGYGQLPKQTLWCEWYGREKNSFSILSATSEYGTYIDGFFCQEIFSPQSLERKAENAIPQSACKNNQPTFERNTGRDYIIVLLWQFAYYYTV
jgi:hypothetical protein